MGKITYGTPGLVDWVAQIKAGAATVRVHFTGGALTAYGVTPAEYTTSNPFIQKVIEQSAYYKNGRIIPLRVMEMPDEAKQPKRKCGEKVAPKQKPTPITGASGSEGTNEEVKIPRLESGEPSSGVEDTEISDPSEVAVSCLQDAQAYLQERFNISSYKVRSYESARKVASEHGVRFTGGKFDILDSVGEVDSDCDEVED